MGEDHVEMAVGYQLLVVILALSLVIYMFLILQKRPKFRA